MPPQDRRGFGGTTPPHSSTTSTTIIFFSAALPWHLLDCWISKPLTSLPVNTTLVEMQLHDPCVSVTARPTEHNSPNTVFNGVVELAFA